MKIEITGFNLEDLLKCLKAFPNGEILVEDKKAFWETEKKFPEHTTEQFMVQNQPMQRRQPQKKQDFFGNMKQSLFKAFSP